jgi:hypothetical protein
MFDLDKITVVQTNILVLKETQDQNNFLHEIAELTAETLSVYFVGIHLVDELEEYIVLKAGNGVIGESLLGHGHKIKIAAHNPYMGQLSTAAYFGQVKLVDWLGHKIISYRVSDNSISEIESEIISDEYFRSPLLTSARTELYLPLQISNKIIGVLELTFDIQVKLGESEISKLQLLANELALAI